MRLKYSKLMIISFLAFFVAQEAMAQRNRPSRGRTSSRTGSSSSSSGSSSSTVSSGGRSSWGSSSGSSSSSSSSSGSSYGGSSSGSSWGSSSGSYSQTYVRRGRSRMRGRNTAPILSYRANQYRRVRSGNVAAIRRYHGRRYRVSRHSSYTNWGSCRQGLYRSPMDYHARIDGRMIYHSSWVMEPVSFTYDSGYSCIDDYPYVVHNGYRYRYSPVDLCNYELVDVEDDEPKVVKTFYAMACNKAFDACAAKRDQLNEDEYAQRYICMEKIDDTLRPSDNYDEIPATVNRLTPEQIKEIDKLLKSSDDRDLFKMGKRGYKGCEITRNSKECNYQVEVDGVPYPMTDGSVCSSTRNTDLELYGCESNSQRNNAACLLALAISEGYCI